MLLAIDRSADDGRLWGENLSKISLLDFTTQKIPFTQTFLYLSKVPFVPIQADHCLVGYLRGNLPAGAKFLRPAHLELPRREDTPLLIILTQFALVPL